MMNLRLHILFPLLAILLLAPGCRHLPLPGTDEDLYGDLVLTIGSNTATKSGSATPEDGDLFHNILLIIADNDGHVVDKVYKSYPCEAEGNQKAVTQEEMIDNIGLLYDRLYFINLRVGYYQVYAYANIEQSDWMSEGTEPGTYLTVEKVEKLLRSDKDTHDPQDPGYDPTLSDDNLDADRQFRTLSGTDVPGQPASWMLLTGHDELYVGVEENIGQVDLYRPVVKFNVILDNHTDYDVTLNSLTFSDFNAPDSYILAHYDENGAPVFPNLTGFRALPACEPDQVVSAHTRKNVYPILLYENRTEEDYRMFANATLDLIDPDTGMNRNLDLVSSGVRRIPYSEIAALAPGSSMTVIMVNPNTNNGKFFGWSGSIARTDAAFNFEEGYRDKAKSLMGNSAYLLTLSKDADGKYHLKKGAKDLFKDFAGESALTLVQGAIPTNSTYPVSSEFRRSLCKFRTSTNKYFYNNSGNLGNTNSNVNHGDKMWVFYEVEPLGTVLRLIDNNTSRVSTLSQMLRGQELTAVMNIYYESLESGFSFTVDNTYWTEDSAHRPGHTFE